MSYIIYHLLYTIYTNIFLLYSFSIRNMNNFLTHTVLCCVFVLFIVVLCTTCCKLHWIVRFWFPLWYSFTFIVLAIMIKLQKHSLTHTRRHARTHSLTQSICTVNDERKITRYDPIPDVVRSYKLLILFRLYNYVHHIVSLQILDDICSEMMDFYPSSKCMFLC